MQYLLLIYADESTQGQGDMGPIMSKYFAYNEEAKKAGVYVGGPFAETKEALGGYYLFDCKDLDEALSWAKKCPALLHGACVEVRPIMVLPPR